MEWLWLAAGVVLVLAVVAGVALWRPLRRLGHEIQVERARELFVLQRERLEAKFVTAASAGGTPRGLRWKDCSFENDLELARDRQTGKLVALIPVAIQFEAVEGGDMEGVPAVEYAKNASAVFYFERGQWLTTGKAVFNMNPDEVIQHFQKQYISVRDELKS
jgi:hypothetical protein